MAGKADIRAGGAFVQLMLKGAAQFRQGLNNASANLKAFGKSAMYIGAGVTAAGAAIIAGLTKAVLHFTSVGSALTDMSARTGVAVDKLSAFQFAAEQTGASLADVEAAIRKQQKAGLGNDFAAMAKEIAAIEDPSLRAARAMEVWGKSGTKLLPMLGDLEALMAEAESLGLIVKPEDAAAADSLGDAFDKIKAVAKAGLFSIGAALAPSLLKASEVVIKILVATKKWIDENRSLFVLIGKIGAGLVAVGGFITAIGGGLAGLGFVFAGIAAAIASFKVIAIAALLALSAVIPFTPINLLVIAFGAAAAAVTALGVAFYKAMRSPEGEQLRTNLSTIGKLIVEITGNVIRLVKEGFNAAVAAVGRLFSAFTGGKTTAVGVFTSISSAIVKVLDTISLLTTDGPKGFAALTTMAKLAAFSLRDAFWGAIAAVQAGFAGLAQNFGTIGRVIGELLFVGVTSGLTKMQEAFATVVETAYQYFVNLFTKVLEMAASAGTALWDAFNNRTPGIASAAAKALGNGGFQAAQGVTGNLRNSDATVGDLLKELQSLGGTIGEEMMRAYQLNSDSAEQAALRGTLTKQLDELRMIRAGRRAGDAQPGDAGYVPGGGDLAAAVPAVAGVTSGFSAGGFLAQTGGSVGQKMLTKIDEMKAELIAATERLARIEANAWKLLTGKER